MTVGKISNISDPLEHHIRILPVHKKALQKLGIVTVENLLYHFPTRYGNTEEIQNIGSLTDSSSAVVFGRISGLKANKSFVKKTTMAEAVVEDESWRQLCSKVIPIYHHLC